MARLEFIDFEPFDIIAHGSQDSWGRDRHSKSIKKLPQIFWADGRAWDEVNLWALEKATSPCKLKTVSRLMSHMYGYATYLEDEAKVDWRHFPTRKEHRVLLRFRGFLLKQVEDLMLALTTARSRMAAVIQFYRFANLHNWVGAASPLWKDQLVAVTYIDSVGFQRTLMRVTTDLAIKVSNRVGLTLEDGLLPLAVPDMSSLLEFAALESPFELHLMLATGGLTGARLTTVLTMTRESLEAAWPDPQVPGIYAMAVGPGTKVSTKFDVQGSLLIPSSLLEDLLSYATSESRLLRQAKAKPEHKSLVFLTRNGRPYSVNTVNRLVQRLRESAVARGLRFMLRFKFHQTRATYGTWLISLLLRVMPPAEALAFLKDAMLHKDEATSMRYVKFDRRMGGKIEVGRAFNEAFSGLRRREPPANNNA